MCYGRIEILEFEVTERLVSMAAFCEILLLMRPIFDLTIVIVAEAVDHFPAWDRERIHQAVGLTRNGVQAEVDSGSQCKPGACRRCAF